MYFPRRFNLCFMKKNMLFFWIATGLIFILEGLLPLSTLIFTPEYITAGTTPLGYPDYFAVALLICKVLGATAILFPLFPVKLKEWAYAGLSFSLIFASLSHFATSGWGGDGFLPLLILGLLMLSYHYKPSLLIPATRQRNR